MRVRRRRCRFWRASSRSVNAISAPPLGLRADLAGLTGLAADVFARVLHALRLVRVRDAQRADLRGDLADDFLVRTGDAHLLRRLQREADAGRRIDLDRVRVAERELQLLAGQRRPVAGTADLEVADIAGRHAGDHVREQRTRQAVDGLRRRALVHALHGEAAVRAVDGHESVEGAPKLTLRALHGHVLAIHLHIHPAPHPAGTLAHPTHALLT